MEKNHVRDWHVDWIIKKRFVPAIAVANTASTVAQNLANGTTATTQTATDISTKIATDAFAQNAIHQAKATLPLNVGSTGGGTYSFAGQGSGALLVFTASGGAVSGVITFGSGGTGYKVGDLLQVEQPGSNFDAIVHVLTVSGSAIASVEILYGGTGYVTGSAQITTTAFLLPTVYTLTGTLTSNSTFIMPNGSYLLFSNQFIVNNNMTGAYTTTFFISSGSDTTTGTGVVIPEGTSNSTAIFLETDGSTDVWPAATINASALKGATLASNVTGSSLTSVGALASGSLASGFTPVTSPLVNLTTATNSLSSNTAMSNTNNYFDGPSLSQGTSGTWFVTCTASIDDTVGAATYFAKLWDGTTVIASGVAQTTAATQFSMISISGVLASPAANIKMSVRDISSTSGFILYNTTGNAKDSTCTGVRIN